MLGRTVCDSGNGETDLLKCSSNRSCLDQLVGMFHISNRASRDEKLFSGVGRRNFSQMLSETKNVLKCWVEGSGRDGRPVTATSLLPPPSVHHSANRLQQPPNSHHTTKPPATLFCNLTLFAFLHFDQTSLILHSTDCLKQPTN